MQHEGKSAFGKQFDFEEMPIADDTAPLLRRSPLNEDGVVIPNQSGVSRRGFINTAFGVLAAAAAMQGRTALATPTNWGGGIPPNLPLPL
jgi:hypothetical protein